MNRYMLILSVMILILVSEQSYAQFGRSFGDAAPDGPQYERGRPSQHVIDGEQKDLQRRSDNEAARRQMEQERQRTQQIEQEKRQALERALGNSHRRERLNF